MLIRQTLQVRAVAGKKCPKCGQLAGSPCRRASTSWSPYVLANPHKERVDLVRADDAARRAQP